VQRVPVGFLQQIIEYRRYTEAYYANKADPKGWSSSEMRTLAQTIELELVAAERADG